MTADELRSRIRSIPDFPKPGIMFRDITTLLSDPAALRAAVQAMAEPVRQLPIDFVVATEARGFIFGAPLALELGVGFIPVRKKGKLPGATCSYTYKLEYGTDTVEIHRDCMPRGSRVLLADDLLATGGTILACKNLVEELGCTVQAATFLIELTFLPGRQFLNPVPTFSAVKYRDENP